MWDGEALEERSPSYGTDPLHNWSGTRSGQFYQPLLRPSTNTSSRHSRLTCSIVTALTMSACLQPWPSIVHTSHSSKNDLLMMSKPHFTSLPPSGFLLQLGKKKKSSLLPWARRPWSSPCWLSLSILMAYPLPLYTTLWPHKPLPTSWIHLAHSFFRDFYVVQDGLSSNVAAAESPRLSHLKEHLESQAL